MACKPLLVLVIFLFPFYLNAQNNTADTTRTDSIAQPVVIPGSGKDMSRAADTSIRSKQVIRQEIENDVVIEKSSRAKEKSLKKEGKKYYLSGDTIRKHNPKIAAGMSALLPGLGQIYNKKYWKLPIIYVGLGLCTYFVYSNTVLFRKYKETYLYKYGIDSSARDFFPNSTSSTVKEAKEYYHKNIEISYIVAGAIYILNIVDATVDAHLFDFNVSDDLSLRIQPCFSGWNTGFGETTYTGLRMVMRF